MHHVGLGESTDHAGVRNDCLEARQLIVDPDAANAAALGSHAALIDKLGGAAKLNDQFSFNHTPAPTS